FGYRLSDLLLCSVLNFYILLGLLKAAEEFQDCVPKVHLLNILGSGEFVFAQLFFAEEELNGSHNLTLFNGSLNVGGEGYLLGNILALSFSDEYGADFRNVGIELLLNAMQNLYLCDLGFVNLGNYRLVICKAPVKHCPCSVETVVAVVA